MSSHDQRRGQLHTRTRTSEHAHAFVHAHAHARAHAHDHAHIHTRTNALEHVHGQSARASARTCAPAHLCTHTHVCPLARMLVDMCGRTCAHAHSHCTYIHSNGCAHIYVYTSTSDYKDAITLVFDSFGLLPQFSLSCIAPEVLL
jgi:hypothetical protein